MKNIVVSCEKCFEDFKEALEEMQEMIAAAKNEGLDERNQKRIVRAFEITHELALKTMGEYFRKMGRTHLNGPRDTTVEAFNEDLIDDGKAWLDMIIERIKYDPLYPENKQIEFTENIVKRYYRLFLNFERKMSNIFN